MFRVPEKYRIKSGAGIFNSDASFGNNGVFLVPGPYGKLKVVASSGMGWEHVSVSHSNRMPNWHEMCFVKDLFWEEEDVVMQIHPAKSNYVNVHNFCLHLWRPVGQEIPTPPIECV